MIVKQKQLTEDIKQSYLLAVLPLIKIKPVYDNSIQAVVLKPVGMPVR